MELDMGQSVYESFVRGGNDSGRYRPPPDRGQRSMGREDLSGSGMILTLNVAFRYYNFS